MVIWDSGDGSYMDFSSLEEAATLPIRGLQTFKLQTCFAPIIHSGDVRDELTMREAAVGVGDMKKRQEVLF